MTAWICALEAFCNLDVNQKGYPDLYALLRCPMALAHWSKAVPFLKAERREVPRVCAKSGAVIELAR